MPKRILCVEDNPNASFALKVLLEMKGHSVATVGTVEAALSALSASTFDVLISDLGLPDAPGWEILRSDCAPRTAIALSGFTSAEDQQHALEHGFTSFLSKPFSTEALLKLIESD